MTYKTASVEILEGDHNHWCAVVSCIALAKYNVFDGNVPMYACGKHLTLAVRRVATQK
jgi:hypothetical protein